MMPEAGVGTAKYCTASVWGLILAILLVPVRVA
jgi:hypothetical protein